MKKIASVIKNFDKKHSNHPYIYWLIFLTACAEYLMLVSNTANAAL